MQKDAYTLILEAIEAGVYKPGDRLVESELAERLGVSRTPVREALVRLASEGLVTTLPNRSTVVSNIDFLKLNSFFDALTLMYRVTTSLAAEYRTDADLAVIRARQAEFAQAVEAQDALEMIATNRELHAAIAEAGRNPYFTGLFRRLLDEGRRILRLYYQSYDEQIPQQFVDEHAALLAAIAARDAETADRLAKEHAEQIVRQIQTLFTRNDRLEMGL